MRHFSKRTTLLFPNYLVNFQVRSQQPTAGLEIMENMTLHMEAAYEHLFRYHYTISEDLKTLAPPEKFKKF